MAIRLHLKGKLEVDKTEATPITNKQGDVVSKGLLTKRLKIELLGAAEGECKALYVAIKEADEVGCFDRFKYSKQTIIDQEGAKHEYWVNRSSWDKRIVKQIESLDGLQNILQEEGLSTDTAKEIQQFVKDYYFNPNAPKVFKDNLPQAPDQKGLVFLIKNGTLYARPTEVIGQGGSKIVYKSRQFNPLLKKSDKVALKQYTDVLKDQDRSIFFEREKFLAEKLQGVTGIVSVECFIDNKVPYLVEHLFENDLCQFVDALNAEKRNGLSRLEKEGQNLIRMQIAKSLAQALANMHAEGVIHRDLKSENIWISTNEKGEKVAHIGDYTGAWIRGEKEAPFLQITSEFMSPELMQNANYNEYPIDMWALGCIYYQLFNKRISNLPWTVNKNIDKANVSSWLKKEDFDSEVIYEIIKQLLDPNPRYRIHALGVLSLLNEPNTALDAIAGFRKQVSQDIRAKMKTEMARRQAEWDML